MKKRFVLSAWVLIVVLLCSGCQFRPLPNRFLPSRASEESGAKKSLESHAETQKAPSIIEVAYDHLEDSQGGQGASGVLVRLLFEPHDRVSLYVASESEILIYAGTYAYEESTSRLHLQFSHDDFSRQADFRIDLTAGEVSMPFQVFSPDEGQSRWRRHTMSLSEGLHFVFRAAAWCDSNMSLTEARDQAFSWGISALESGESTEPIQSIETTETGILITYDDDFPVGQTDVVLWTYIVEEETAPLSLSPIAGDPRVHLQTEPYRPASSDPDNRTALFIAPFRDEIHLGYSAKKLFGVLPIGRSMEIHLATDPKNNPNFKFEEMGAIFAKNDYAAHGIYNNDVTVMRLIEALSGRGIGGPAPGFIVFVTHGLPDGSLATGELIGASLNCQEARETLNALYQRMDMLGYKDVFNQHIKLMNITRGFTSSGDYFVSIKPSFWQWLRESQNADFSSTLFYSSACLTNRTPYLREAIQARSFFGWTISVHPELAGAVFQYLVQTLSWPSHSAEEAYYNIMRVVNTNQMIYPEDKLFDRVFPGVGACQPARLEETLQAYGFDGTYFIPYLGNGWLAEEHNQGQIWWMLFAGRWGQCAETGADNLMACWDDFWSQGDLGRLGGVFANAANIGVLPTAEEVAYTQYLLTGDTSWLLPSGPYCTHPLIPRWTMNDRDH